MTTEKTRYFPLVQSYPLGRVSLSPAVLPDQLSNAGRYLHDDLETVSLSDETVRAALQLRPSSEHRPELLDDLERLLSHSEFDPLDLRKIFVTLWSPDSMKITEHVNRCKLRVLRNGGKL